jgi:hypothetical protein
VKKMLLAVSALSAASLSQTVSAADETHLGATVGNVMITKSIKPGALSLKNMSSSKLASKRDMVVTGDNPRFTVTGQVFCRDGAKLTAVQAVLGNTLVQHMDIITFQQFGHSAKDISVAGRKDADVELQVELNVGRRANNDLMPLKFNPANVFEQKLGNYVAKGNSAAEYLRETQAFDMDVSVNLVAWCKMDPNANSVLAGRTYAGLSAREVPMTILYNGDPSIIDSPAPRAKATTREVDGGPPVK